jgi:hypothetical protein
MGFLDVLKKIAGGVSIASDPASALGASAADNRRLQNNFADSRGRTLSDIYRTQVGQQTGIYGSQADQQTSQYGTQQQAILNALLGSSREAQGNAQIDLDRRKFALDAPGTRANQAVRGSLLQTAQPFRISGGSPRLQAHTPTISGGANEPLGPGAREAGSLLEGIALSGLRSGDTFDPLQKTDFQGGVLKPPGILAAPTPIAAPKLPDYQGPGAIESILGALGLAKPVIDNILNKLKNNVPGSGVNPYTFGGTIDRTPPEPPPGLTGETSGRFYADPWNMDPFNPYAFGTTIDTNAPDEPFNPYTFGGGIDTSPPQYDDWWNQEF